MAQVWRGTWRERALLLLCVLGPTFAASQLCSRGEYRPEDESTGEASFCCRKCHPGEKLVKDCEGDHLRTQCAPCDPNTYQLNMNYAPTCRSCRDCRASDHEVQVSACSPTQDTVCRCDKGFYRKKIDSQTQECQECKTCGRGEKVLFDCTPENNTVCVCEDSFYRSDDECLPCESCSKAFPSLCVPRSGDTVVYGIMSACFIVVLAVAVVITSQLTKSFEKRKTSFFMESCSPSSESSSQDGERCTQQLMYEVESPDTDLQQPVFRTTGPVCECECDSVSELPDCVPRVIKIDQLIYAVLEEVPVRSIKQLVRSLGVSEREIERAQEDHRTIKEAHYQMFLVWAQGGARGGAGGAREVLPRPSLQVLLEKLRMLDLDGIAEKLEITYGVK